MRGRARMAAPPSPAVLAYRFGSLGPELALRAIMEGSGGSRRTLVRDRCAWLPGCGVAHYPRMHSGLRPDLLAILLADDNCRLARKARCTHG